MEMEIKVGWSAFFLFKSPNMKMKLRIENDWGDAIKPGKNSIFLRNGKTMICRYNIG